MVEGGRRLQKEEGRRKPSFQNSAKEEGRNKKLIARLASKSKLLLRCFASRLKLGG